MKTRSIIFVIFLMTVVVSGFSQNTLETKERARKVRVADKEAQKATQEANRLLAQYPSVIDVAKVRKLEEQISSLKIAAKSLSDTVPEKYTLAAEIAKKQASIDSLKSVDNRPEWVKKEIARQMTIANKYQRISDSIRYAFSTSNKVEELSDHELRRRTNGHTENRMSMVDNLQAANLSTAVLTGDYDQTKGFKGILLNKYGYEIMFRFCPLDGGQEKSVLLASGKWQEDWLVPGKYLVRFIRGGEDIFPSQILHVNANRHTISVPVYNQKTRNWDNVPKETSWFTFTTSGY